MACDGLRQRAWTLIVSGVGELSSNWLGKGALRGRSGWHESWRLLGIGSVAGFFLTLRGVVHEEANEPDSAWLYAD